MGDETTQNLYVRRDGGAVKATAAGTGEAVFESRGDHEALQRAIDAQADGGGEVTLGRGDFVLDEPLRLASNVTLRGGGRGTRLRVGKGNTAGVCVLGEGVDGAVVADLALNGAGPGEARSGVVLDDCGDCTLRGLFAVGFAEHGLEVRNNSFLCHVHGCSLTDNARAGLAFRQLARDGRAGDYVPNMVSDCTVYGGQTGIECERAIVVNITGCQAFQTRGPAYHIHSVSNSVAVSGCRSFQIETDAVVVEHSHEINITGNIFCWHRGHGIVLRDVTWGAVSGNNVIDSGGCQYDKPRMGIVLEEGTRGVQVTGNAVFNWGGQGPMTRGIHEDTSCTRNAISHNNLNFATEALVTSMGPETVTANNIGQMAPSYLGTMDNQDREFRRGPIERFLAQYRGEATPR